MDIELIREQVRINSFVGEETTSAIVENDIIVPDAKPDIERVLNVSGEIYSVGMQVAQDKVVVDGAVRYNILYLCSDELQPVRNMTATVNFSQNVFVSGIRMGMNPFVEFNIQYIDHSVVNGRKINIKTIADVAVSVVSDNQEDVVTDIRGIEDIQTRTETVKISGVIGDEQDSFIIREEFSVSEEKPAILEILSTTARFSGKDMKLTDDKVITKGDFVVSCLYIADDEQQSIQFIRKEIPFTQFMDFPGMNEDRDCKLFYELKDFVVQQRENSDGEQRDILIEAVVDVRVVCTDSAEVEMITDAYSPTYNVNLERKDIAILQYVSEGVREQEHLHEKIYVQDDGYEVRDVVNVSCAISSVDCEVYEDRVALEGIVSFDVLCLSQNRERPIYSYLQEFPFKKVVDVAGIKPGMKCELVVDAGMCTYRTISSTEVEIDQVLDMWLKVNRDVNIQVITGAKLEPIDKNYISEMPSIVMYYVQPEDTLWNIAKRYYTTVQDIVAVNVIQHPDRLEEGQYIIIPKRAE